MHINRENYEAWLLDMMEGELSAEQEEEVRKFMEKNPDLEIGTDLVDITLTPCEIKFPIKEHLKKGAGSCQITKGNYEQFCIAQIEGDLSASAETALDEFLSDNPECARTARLYGIVKLKPDNSVFFSEKHLLRKRSPASGKIRVGIGKRAVYRVLAVAASVLLLISASVFIWNYSRNDHLVAPFADRETILPTETDQVSDAFTTPLDRHYSGQTSEVDIETLISASAVHEDLARATATMQEEPVNTGPGFVNRDHGLIPLPVNHLNSKFEIKTSLSGPQLYPVRLAGHFSMPSSDTYREESQLPEMLISGVMGLLSRKMSDEPERERITLWDIADAGLKGINNVAGTDMQFEREYSSEGELVSMAFNSRLIGFRRSTTISGD